MFVYVLDRNGKPLMPCKPAIARLLLKDKKAKVIRKTPFTIKMLVETTDYKQSVVAGLDTGSKDVGCAAITNGKVVYQSEIRIRQDVSKKMNQRKMYRRNRRSRKIRYRPARYNNRAASRRKGRLPPSIRSKIDSHLREKSFVESILPVSYWKVETASFDIHRVSNPDVVDYQDGNQKGYYNTKAYVLSRDGYKCWKCKSKNVKLRVHHIIFRSKGGTDTPDNLITLCEDCHEALHAGKFTIKGKRSKTKHATEMGIIKSQLKKRFGIFEETFGYETKFKREKILKLPKTHYNDAVAICCEDGELVETSGTVYYKRHVSSGDYQQTKGKHSQIRLPTGKLFGLRKFDLIETPKGVGFIKGKRSTGRFVLCDIFWKTLVQVGVKRDCKRLTARASTLIQERHLPLSQQKGLINEE